MKILALNGSFRGERGYTRILIDHLLAGAQELGAETEILHLAKMKINHCLGCNHCQPGEQSGAAGAAGLSPCVFNEKDDVALIYEKMAAADLVIYASPIYVFDISSLLKSLLERFYGIANCSDLAVTNTGLMFHHVNPQVCSKPFVGLLVCDNLEDETPRNAREYFKTFSRFMDAPLAGVLVRNAGQIIGHGRDPQAEEKFSKLKEVYTAYHQAGRELVQTGKISSATLRRANQEILPVPGFAWLKKIRLRSLKEKFVQKAYEMRTGKSVF